MLIAERPGRIAGITGCSRSTLSGSTTGLRTGTIRIAALGLSVHYSGRGITTNSRAGIATAGATCGKRVISGINALRIAMRNATLTCGAFS